MVYEPSGGIMQIVVDQDHRNQYIGREFIKYLVDKCSNIDKLISINVDKRDSVLLSFLEKLGFKSFTTQYEMMLNI